MASLLKVGDGSSLLQKILTGKKILNKIKKNLKNLKKKKFVGEGLRSISCNSNFAVEFLLFTSIYYNDMLPKKLGEGATPYAWYFIFLSVNLNLLRKKWDPPLPPMLRAFVRTMNHIVNIYQHCPAVTYLIKVFCFTEWLHDKKYTYKRMLRSILFPRDTTGISFCGWWLGEGELGFKGSMTYFRYLHQKSGGA